MMKNLQIFLLLCGVVWVPILLTYSYNTQSREGSVGDVAPNFTWNVNTSRDLAIYVEPENTTAVITNENLCSSNSADHRQKPLLLIVVCSAVGNVKARDVIRKTWMSVGPNETAPFDVRTVFLLGQTINDTKQSDVLLESNTHRDIIQEGFIDAYLNLTLKSVMMLKWVKTYCPQVTFVLKTDDDMFINVRTLTEYLSQSDVQARKDLIVGSLFCRVSPIKDAGSKWYSPLFMYDAKVYPDYVSGTGYVISGPLVPILFENALHVPLFHLEDVYTTGIVAKRANVIPENSHLFSFVKHPTTNPCLYRKIITSHGLNPSELKSVWRQINDPLLNCTSVRLPKIGDPKFKKCHKTARLSVRRSGRKRF